MKREFCGYLVYKIRMIVIKKILTRYKKIDYNMVILWQNLCVVIYPVMVYNFASLFKRRLPMDLFRRLTPDLFRRLTPDLFRRLTPDLFRRLTPDYPCLWSGLSWSCLWFSSVLSSTPLSHLLFVIKVFVIKCVSLRCFTDEVEDPYMDRTHHEDMPI